MRPNQTLAGLTARVMTDLTPVLEEVKPDLVLVQGDTTTVLTAALAAFYLQIRWGMWRPGCGPTIGTTRFPRRSTAADWPAGHAALLADPLGARQPAGRRGRARDDLRGGQHRDRCVADRRRGRTAQAGGSGSGRVGRPAAALGDRPPTRESGRAAGRHLSRAGADRRGRARHGAGLRDAPQPQSARHRALDPRRPPAGPSDRAAGLPHVCRTDASGNADLDRFRRDPGRSSSIGQTGLGAAADHRTAGRRDGRYGAPDRHGRRGHRVRRAGAVAIG